MSDFNRRTLMKTLGAGSLAVSGISGTAAASGATASPGESEELSTWEAYQYLLKSLEYEPVEEMRTYLRQEKRAWIDTDGLSGKKIIPEEHPAHALLTVPLARTEGEEGLLFIRVFEKTAVATVDIDGSVFKSNPDIVDSDVSIASSTEDDYGVVTGREWREQVDSNGGEVSIQIDCDTTFGPVEVGGPLCGLIQGTALLAGAVATVVPEPYSTAVGYVTLTSGAVGGTCRIGQEIDKYYDCNITKVKICVEWNCSVRRGWCEPVPTIWSPDCN